MKSNANRNRSTNQVQTQPTTLFLQIGSLRQPTTQPISWKTAMTELTMVWLFSSLMKVEIFFWRL